MLLYLFVDGIETKPHRTPQCDDHFLSVEDIFAIHNKQLAFIISEDPVDFVHVIDVNVWNPKIAHKPCAHSLK